MSDHHQAAALWERTPREQSDRALVEFARSLHDAFCRAAKKLSRQWVGSDINHSSIAAMRYGLATLFPDIKVDVDQHNVEHAFKEEAARLARQGWRL